MIQFKVVADGPDLLVVRFEPLAWEVTLSPGDHILIEWPAFMPGASMAGMFCHAPGRLTIGEPNFTGQGNWARVWNSKGEEITY